MTWAPMIAILTVGAIWRLLMLWDRVYGASAQANIDRDERAPELAERAEQ